MAWPLASDFSAIVQQPRYAFRDAGLQTYQIERNSLNQPRVWSGQFAVVYKGVDPQGRAWALRAFTRESNKRREHYDHISEYLKARKLHCLVDFSYCESAIRSAGDSKWYPLVVMDWVDGMTLFDWVRSKSRKGKGKSIAKAVRHWVRLVAELNRNGIAHGDLQHANVLVTPRGRLKLVDYDGMCVPALVGRQNLEIGVLPYQHPQRDDSTLLAANLDHFSAWVIYVALRALSADPSLWGRHVEETGYDRLLFRVEDFQDRERSALYHDLMTSPDSGVRDLAARLFSFARGSMHDVPPLDDLTVDVPDSPTPPRSATRSVSSPIQRSEVNSGPRVVLKVIAGPIQGKTFVIDRHDTLVLGRGADCHLRITDDPRVSRHHFVLEAVPPNARIRDLGSRNGTWVNRTQYGGQNTSGSAGEAPPAPELAVDLKHGDRLRVGRTLIEFQIEGVVAEPDQPTSVPSSKTDMLRREKNRIIDRLDVGQEIWQGQLGTVYMAVDQENQQTVALKIVEPQMPIDDQRRGQIFEELAMLQGLRHPNLVGVLETGIRKRAFYCVMEHCDGGTLDQWMQELGGKLTLGQARPLMYQCLDALDFLHTRELIHRDLRPQNILIHRVDGKATGQIAAHGLARTLEMAGCLGMTATNQGVMNYRFIPPEYVTDYRQCRPESDLWSMAAVFYYMLTAQTPNEWSKKDPIAAVLAAETVPIRDRDPRLPQPVSEVIDHALTKDISGRYHSAAQMKSQLKRAFSLVRRD